MSKKIIFKLFAKTSLSLPQQLDYTQSYRQKKNSIMALKKPNGAYTKEEEKRAILLLQIHFPDSKPTSTKAAIND